MTLTLLPRGDSRSALAGKCAIFAELHWPRDDSLCVLFCFNAVVPPPPLPSESEGRVSYLGMSRVQASFPFWVSGELGSGKLGTVPVLRSDALTVS